MSGRALCACAAGGFASAAACRATLSRLAARSQVLICPRPPTVVNPDVIASRVERGRELKDAAVLESRGEAWVASQKKHIAANPEKISIFGFERKFA